MEKNFKVLCVLALCFTLAGCSSNKTATADAAGDEVSAEASAVSKMQSKFNLDIYEEEGSKYSAAYDFGDTSPIFLMLEDLTEEDQEYFSQWNLTEHELLFAYELDGSIVVFAVDSEVLYISEATQTIEEAKEALNTYLTETGLTLEEVKTALSEYYAENNILSIIE